MPVFIAFQPCPSQHAISGPPRHSLQLQRKAQAIRHITRRDCPTQLGHADFADEQPLPAVSGRAGFSLVGEAVLENPAGGSSSIASRQQLPKSLFRHVEFEQYRAGLIDVTFSFLWRPSRNSPMVGQRKQTQAGDGRNPNAGRQFWSSAERMQTKK